MGVAFVVVYHELVAQEDIPRISTADKGRVKQAIEEKLSSEPDLFGKPRRRSLKGYRKLRVGDYRVIFRIEKRKVKVLCVGHRSIVYREIGKRIAY